MNTNNSIAERFAAIAKASGEAAPVFMVTGKAEMAELITSSAEKMGGEAIWDTNPQKPQGFGGQPDGQGQAQGQPDGQAQGQAQGHGSEGEPHVGGDDGEGDGEGDGEEKGGEQNCGGKCKQPPQKKYNIGDRVTVKSTGETKTVIGHTADGKHILG